VQISGGRGHRPVTLLASENYSDCSFIWYQNIGSMFFHLVTKHACGRQMNRETDGQNYDPQDCSSIAASYSNNLEANSTHG